MWKTWYRNIPLKSQNLSILHIKQCIVENTWNYSHFSVERDNRINNIKGSWKSVNIYQIWKRRIIRGLEINSMYIKITETKYVQLKLKKKKKDHEQKLCIRSKIRTRSGVSNNQLSIVFTNTCGYKIFSWFYVIFCIKKTAG